MPCFFLVTKVAVLAGCLFVATSDAFQATLLTKSLQKSIQPLPTSAPTTVSQEPLFSSTYQKASILCPASASANEGEFSQKKNETPAQRMRRRKVNIYNQRKGRATVLLFALWYTLSVGYNIFSKRVLNLAPELAWTAAWAQMAGGLLYVLPVWASGLRSPPQVSAKDVCKRILPVALLHSLVHVGGVISMGAGAVSFTYIVKATEPAVSAGLSAVFLKSFLPIPVYLTLIPVIAGVSLASVSELTFSWKAFNYAMLSNVASASRGIVSKKTMRNRVGKNVTAMNLYAILTILATVLLFPVAAVIEGPQWVSSAKRLKQTGQAALYVTQTLLAALTYYLYNEVSFMALNNISPVSHALASTLRRVFIIVTSMLAFGNKMTPVGVLGSAMAVGGAFLYSAAKHHYKQKDSA